MSESRRRGLLRLRGLMERVEAAGEELVAKADRFNRLDSPDAAPRVAVGFNLFQTPEPLAGRLAVLLSLAFLDRVPARVLEPSAGLGRLYKAARAQLPDSRFVLVDESPECARELYEATAADPNATLRVGDFLTMDAERLGGTFDAVIMNPPFHRGADLMHVFHAHRLLNPGGRLVAVVAGTPKRRESLIAVPGAVWEPLPAGTFKPEGTDVSAAIVVIDKPRAT